MRFLNKMGVSVRRESDDCRIWGLAIGRMEMALSEIGKSRDEAYLGGEIGNGFAYDNLKNNQNFQVITWRGH